MPQDDLSFEQALAEAQRDHESALAQKENWFGEDADLPDGKYLCQVTRLLTNAYKDKASGKLCISARPVYKVTEGAAAGSVFRGDFQCNATQERANSLSQLLVHIAGTESVDLRQQIAAAEAAIAGGLLATVKVVHNTSKDGTTYQNARFVERLGG